MFIMLSQSWVRASTHPETAHASGNTGFPYGGFSWAAAGNICMDKFVNMLLLPFMLMFFFNPNLISNVPVM